jgi:hypothetical protein
MAEAGQHFVARAEILIDRFDLARRFYDDNFHEDFGRSTGYWRGVLTLRALKNAAESGIRSLEGGTLIGADEKCQP